MSTRIESQAQGPRDSNGQGRARIIDSSSGSVTDLNARQLQFMDDTVCSVLTRDDLTGSFATRTIKAGTVLWGRFTAVTVTSGWIVAYD